MVDDSKTTELDSNPFAVLGASTRDNRRQIVELAAQRALHFDDQRCQRARAELTNPRLRVGAEIGWLPGLSPNKAAQVMKQVVRDPISVRHEPGIPSLARANLIAAALERLGDQHSVSEIAALINQFAVLADNLVVSEILRDINEDRLISGFPSVESPDVVEAALSQRKRYYRDAIKKSLNGMLPRKLVLVMTAVVETSTRRGTSHAPELIDEVVDSYEIESKGFLEKEGGNVEALTKAVREVAALGAPHVNHLLGKLEEVVRNWDMVVQPIQLSMKARGISHRPSNQLGFRIRNLAVELCNDHDLVAEADRITQLLRDLFSELPEFVDTIDEDSTAIADIVASKQEREAKEKQRRNDLTYEAEIGVLFKDRLRLSADGIEWGRHRYSLESITRVRWGGVSHSVNGIPTGTTYTIAFGDPDYQSIVELRREDVYTVFTEKLWKAVCIRLIIQMLHDLRAGRGIAFGDAVIEDNGVILTKFKLFGRNESATFSWDDVVVSSESGSFFIRAKADRGTYTALSYIEVPNVHLLEHVIRMAFKQGADNLSDILAK